MMENKKHFINLEIPELYFEKYTLLLSKFAECRGDISKEDSILFEELFKIFLKEYENLR